MSAFGQAGTAIGYGGIAAASNSPFRAENILNKANVVALLIHAKNLSLSKKPKLSSEKVTYINPLYVLFGSIPITVRTQEVTSFRSNITQHAVESGSVFADHVILQPIQVDLEFEISNWSNGDARSTLEMLKRLWETRTPVSMLTTHSQIDNMVMTSVRAENSVPQWGALVCRASFTQVNYVKLKQAKYDFDPTTPTENTSGPDTQLSNILKSNQGKKNKIQVPFESAEAQAEFEALSPSEKDAGNRALAADLANRAAQQAAQGAM